MNASQRMKCKGLVASALAHARAVRQAASSFRATSESDRRMTAVLGDAAAALDRMAAIVQSMLEPPVRKARPNRRRSEAA